MLLCVLKLLPLSKFSNKGGKIDMSRIFNIVDLLVNNKESMTINSIAERLNVSNKTIRNDLIEVNKFIQQAGLVMIKKPGVGIKIEGQEDKVLKLMNEIQSSLNKFQDFSPEARKNYILKRLFMSYKSLTMQELGDELYVSRVTIYKDLNDVEKWLSNYNLALLKKPNYGIEVVGAEEDWRNAISSLIVYDKAEDELKELLYVDYGGKIDYKTITKLKELINLDYSLIEKIVLEAEKELGIRFSDEAYLSLVMHIAISIKRLRGEKNIQLSQETISNLQLKNEYPIAKEIAIKIGEAFQVELPESEVGYILLHILGTKMQEKTSSEMDLNLEFQADNQQAVIMSREIISIAERVLNIKLSEDIQLLNGLILHLRPTINRLKYGLTLRNPIINEIKESYPEMFGVAWMTSVVFEKYLGIKIQEEEIGYIALHIGASVERNRNLIRVLVVCASGIGTSQLLAARLRKGFRQLEIMDIISFIALEEKPLVDIDIIISTVPIKANKPVLNISPILTQNDIKRLEKFIDSFGKPSNEQNYLGEIFDEDLFFLNKQIFNKEDAITFLCKELIKRDIVEEPYLSSVLEREKLASTEVGSGVSIPHGEPKFVRNTRFSLLTLKEPIIWGEEKVNIIFMVCISPKDLAKARQIVTYINEFLESEELLGKILSIRNSYEIKQTLLNLIF